MKKWLGFFGAFLFSSVVFAQTTVVVGVATDSDSTLWTNGTVSAQFVPNPSQPNLNVYRINGAPLSSTVIMQGPISLGSGGNFSITVYDNTQITPSGSQWQFTVCPNAISKCGSVTTSVSGSGQSITTLIDAAIPAPRFPAVAGSYGYADVEGILSTPVGGTYWNVVSSCQRYYNGSSWSCGNLPAGCVVGGAIPISCGGTGATTAAGALANLGGLPLSGGTLTGALTGTSASFSGTVVATNVNGILFANNFTGATASEKMIACLAAVGDGGTCDATGLTGVQVMDAMVEVGASSKYQILLVSPSTTFQPTVAGMTMFKVDRNGQAKNIHINIPSALNFTGNAMDIEDTITNVNVNTFSIDGLKVDAGSYGTAGTCLYLKPPANSWIQLTNFHDIQCNGLLSQLYIYAPVGTYVNGVNFSDMQMQGNGKVITLKADYVSSVSYGEINGNTFSSVITEGLGPGISFEGTGSIQNNIGSIFMWDTTTPISNTNTGCTGYTGACRNMFYGGSSYGIVDPNASGLPVGLNNKWDFFGYERNVIETNYVNTQQLNVRGPVPWLASDNSVSIGWNSVGGGDMDYTSNAIVGLGNWSHIFRQPNSTTAPTGYTLLGGFRNTGDFEVSSGDLLMTSGRIRMYGAYLGGVPLGGIALPNTVPLYGATAANNVDIPLISLNGNNKVSLDSAGVGVILGGTIQAIPALAGVATLGTGTGTVTVSATAACAPSATCVYKLANCNKNASTGIGTLSIGTVSAGTSFIINSLGPTAAVLTTDASTVCWQIN